MKKLYFSFVALITFLENLLCAFGIIFCHSVYGNSDCKQVLAAL